MTCRCAPCVLRDSALDALDAGVLDSDASADMAPEVRAEVVKIVEATAENLRATADTCIEFARRDMRESRRSGDRDFDVRAAMFHGLAFRNRELAADVDAQATAWREGGV